MTVEQERLTSADISLAHGSSVWWVTQRSLTMQRRGRFLSESGQHPGRMAPDLAAEAIRRYSEPGDLVLDPMCGIGTTLVEAVHAGREALGIEYEPRWADLAHSNLALATRQGAAGHGTVLVGDARRLAEQPRMNFTPIGLVGSGGAIGSAGDMPASAAGSDERAGPANLASVAGRVRLVLTSPPYGPSTHGRVHVPPDRSERGRVISHLFENYGDRRDPANLAHTEPVDLHVGLQRILTGSARLLHPDGVVVITARPWRRDGLLVDLPSMVIEAAEQAGLQLVDRCVALLAAEREGRLIPRHSFHQLLQLRRSRLEGRADVLLAHEDVLVLAPRLEHPTRRTDWRGNAPL